LQRAQAGIQALFLAKARRYYAFFEDQNIFHGQCLESSPTLKRVAPAGDPMAT